MTGYVVDASWGPMEGKLRFLPAFQVDDRHWEWTGGEEIEAKNPPGVVLGVWHPEGIEAANAWIDRHDRLLASLVLKAFGLIPS